jgi:ADP-ribose pyrophosphatase YjhB (NUDIX family)
MKEYKIENGDVNTKQLEAIKLPEDIYSISHKGLVILCHDVFIEYQKGILLVNRLILPAKDILWPLGGRIERGKSIEESLRKKVYDESKLEIVDITELGHARTYFKTDPFNHGMGTDSLNFVYFAKAKGTLKLDNKHKEPTIIYPHDYPNIKNTLHPYVKDFMDLAIPHVN